tara:strand:+ start:65674 stop:67542 length:1869 start_codon:yes stop_codon:yes gene_type:complete
MKTSNSCHWIIAIAFTLFTFKVYSLGGSGTRTLTCAAGWKVETVRQGRTYSQKCVVDSETMSKPEYNRELYRTPTSSAPAAAPATKKTTNNKTTKKNQSKSASSEKKQEADSSENSDDIDSLLDDKSEPSTASGNGNSEASDYQKCNASSFDAIFVGGVCKSKDSMVDPGCFPPSALSQEEYNKMWSDINSGNSNYVNVTKTITDDQGKNIPMTQFCSKDSGGKSVADDNACEQRFNAARDMCFTQSNKAGTDCDQENEGIQAAMQATKAVGAGSAVNVQLACSKLGEISKIANASLGSWQTYCAVSQSGCESSCTEAKSMYYSSTCIPQPNRASYTSDIKAIEEHISACVAYKKRISEAAQHATAALAQLQASKQCEQDTSALTTASLNECKNNPNNPLCTDAQKCSNAEFAATNKVCTCINNPSSKDCIASTSAAGNRGVAGSTIPGVGGSTKGVDGGTSLIGTGGTGAAGPDAFADSLQKGATKNEQNLGGSKGSANLGGGSGPGGGGGLGMNAAGAAGGGGPEDKSKINSGFYGSATAGGGYFGKTGGVGGSYRPNAGGVNYNKLGAGGAQFDPRRYIAGLNGKAGEYINGPNMDIFRIVKNRIESKKPTMLDPDYKK